MYAVWEWAVEIGLGSHLQRKVSSRIVKLGFDSKADAMAWAETQDKSTWGFWEPCEAGRRVILEVPYDELPSPRSYSAAVALMKELGQEHLQDGCRSEIDD